MKVQEAIELLDNLVGMIEYNQNNDYDKALKMGKEALEKQSKLERVIERLEEEGRLADEEKERCARENPFQFDRAVGYSNGIFNAIEFIKEELM